jgi:hypothetical protein
LRPEGQPQFGLMSAAVLLLAGVCLTIGSAIGLLWAFSEPNQAPHVGLYIGLPGGLLFLEGVAAGLAGGWMLKRWAGYKLAAPLLIGLVPAVCLAHPGGILMAGLVGLMPFTLLARLLARL